jgi:Heterokaryon incompatibility protein (HET)
MDLQSPYLLCDLCKDISIETLNTPEGFKHADDSMFSTKTSDLVDEKCQLCVSFTHQIDLHHKRNFRLHLDSKGNEKYRTLGISYEGYDESDIIRYPVFTDEGDPAALAGVRIRRRPELPSSPEAYEVAKSWIDDCRSNHLCWSSRVTSTQLERHPARLIDLEPLLPFNENSKDARIIPYRLANSKYATLSYCWGTTMPPGSATTQDNIRKRSKRLEASSLPQTLRDGFTVTRQLEIRYLWVDALCIIQDDPNDWATEAAKMASIYGNCLVSIAVELGSDCTAGFLSHTPEQQDFCVDRLIKIPNRLKSGKTSNLYIWTGGICGCYYISGVKSLEKTPLSERGWTYQERFLAPRILHFIGAQIVWECREVHGVSLERGLSLEDTILHRSPSTFGGIAKLVLQPENTVNQKKLRENWYYDIVPEYSQRKLSQKSDKLPAISGIAKPFTQRFEDVYFAGFWLGDISYSLSWGTELTTKYPGFYRAPSFCWASVDGDVFYPRGTRENLTHYVHVVDHHIDFQGPDSYGCVTGGWIKIVGYLGNGIIRDGQLLDEETDFILGYAYFDTNRWIDAHKGRLVKYLLLSTAAPGHFNACRVLLLQQRREKEFEFERIGLSVSAGMDVHINYALLAKRCIWTELTLF